jgi:hypothetical protein
MSGRSSSAKAETDVHEVNRAPLSRQLFANHVSLLSGAGAVRWMRGTGMWADLSLRGEVRHGQSLQTAGLSDSFLQCAEGSPTCSRRAIRAVRIKP